MRREALVKVHIRRRQQNKLPALILLDQLDVLTLPNQYQIGITEIIRKNIRPRDISHHYGLRFTCHDIPRNSVQYFLR